MQTATPAATRAAHRVRLLTEAEANESATTLPAVPEAQEFSAVVRCRGRPRSRSRRRGNHRPASSLGLPAQDHVEPCRRTALRPDRASARQASGSQLHARMLPSTAPRVREPLQWKRLAMPSAHSGTPGSMGAAFVVVVVSARRSSSSAGNPLVTMDLGGGSAGTSVRPIDTHCANCSELKRPHRDRTHVVCGLRLRTD